MLIPFADWMPDIAPLDNAGTLVARNVLPQAKGYRHFPGLAVYPGPAALAGRIIGAFSAKDRDGNTYNYAANAGTAANAARLHVLSGAAWSDKSGAGVDGNAGYSVADGEAWEFVKWGETAIAVTISEPAQSIAFGGASFANLIASARKPKARHIAVARDFVILGNVNDDVGGGDGPAATRVWWSAINDPTIFEAGGALSQSDYQDLQSGGSVQRIVGGEFATVFCETSIYRMTYVGSPLVWQFDEIERNRGAFVPGAVATSGRLTFFLDRDGWYAWDGQTATPIGVNKIDRFFLAEFDANFAHRVSAVADPINHLFHCAYPSVSAAGGVPDRVLSYDWVNGRWSVAEIQVEWLFRALSESYTVDSLDALSASIDGLTTSLDSPVYQGKNIYLAGFNADHRLCSFTGPALPAVIDTGERQLGGPGGARAFVSSVRPVVDGAASVTVQPYVRDLPTQAPAAGAISAVNAAGECPMRSNARYHRFRTVIAGEFAAALGVEVTTSAPAGGR